MDKTQHECQALLFDVFGTLLNWRSSITRDLQTFFAGRPALLQQQSQPDWEAITLDWRALYQPSMQAVRDGSREFVILDTLHRESLVITLDKHGIPALPDAALDELTLLWHRLDPWPDVSAGLHRLRSVFTLAAVSNANTQLLKDLARYADLPWHVSLGAEPARAYKPTARTYQYSAAMLALDPAECMMVAAHNDDLRAARALGFRTAYINRPQEYGPRQTADMQPDSDWDYCAQSLEELADQLNVQN